MGPKRILYTEQDIESACSAVREGQKAIREAARTYGIPHASLQGWLKGRPTNGERKRAVLSAEFEHLVVDWLKESAQRGTCQTKEQILKTIQDILKDSKEETPFKENRLGRKWFENFMKRHGDEVGFGVRKGTPSGTQRAAEIDKKVQGWFDQAYKDIVEIDPHVLNDPERIFHCDEVVFQLSSGIEKVKAPQKDNYTDQAMDDTQEQVTVMACGSASGHVLPPLLVFLGQCVGYDPLAGFSEAHFSQSENGRLDSKIFQSWFESSFIPEVSHFSKTVLLFVSGHKTLLSQQVSELCREHSIILYQLPNDTSEVVQPLDMTTFENLKQAWKEEVRKYQEEMSVLLSKENFAKVLKRVWQHGIEKDDVISGFKVAGIYPWDPHQVMVKQELSRLNMSVSETVPVLNPSTNQTVTAVPTDSLTSQKNPASAVPADSVTSPTADSTTTSSKTVTAALADSMTSSSQTMTVDALTSPTKRVTAVPTDSVISSTQTVALSPEITNPAADDHITDSNAIFPLSSNLSPSSCLNAVSNLPASPPAFQDCALFQHTACSSEHSETPGLTLSEGLDRLLDLVSINGQEKLVLYRTSFDIRRLTTDPIEEQFKELYKKLKTELQARDHFSRPKDKKKGNNTISEARQISCSLPQQSQQGAEKQGINQASSKTHQGANKQRINHASFESHQAAKKQTMKQASFEPHQEELKKGISQASFESHQGAKKRRKKQATFEPHWEAKEQGISQTIFKQHQGAKTQRIYQTSFEPHQGVKKPRINLAGFEQHQESKKEGTYQANFETPETVISRAFRTYLEETEKKKREKEEKKAKKKQKKKQTKKAETF